MPRRCVAIVFACLFIVLDLASCRAGDADLFVRERQATVRIGGCSGVCISPDGYVLSAKHCRHRNGVAVQFADRSHETDVVAVAPTVEGAVLLKAAGGPFPYVPLASSPPAVGEPVHTHGFPSGQYRFYRGSIEQMTGGAFEPGRSAEEGFWYTTVDRPMFPGHSGGPLFNTRGEVVGLLSSTDTRSSLWIPLAHIRQLVEQAVCKQPTVYVFTRPGCVPCEALKADVRAGRFRDYSIEFVTFENGRWNRPDVVQELRRQVGEATLGEIQTPTFWVQGGPQVWVGYTAETRTGLLNWLRDMIEKIGRISICPLGRRSPPPSHPPPQPTPSDPSERNDVDWSQVEIVALASDETPSALRFVAGPARRALEELTDGRAQLTIVAERTQPVRYRAVVEVSGVTPAPLFFLVLVEQQDLGLRGLILEPIERRLRNLTSQQQKLPIELIFRRAHPDDFAAIEAALDISEVDVTPSIEPESSVTEGVQQALDEMPQPPAPDDDPLPWLWGLLAAPLAALKRRYLDEETNR